MRTTPRLAFRGGWRLLVFLLSSAVAFAQGGAALTGQVSNQATRDYLEGALVEIAGTNRSTTTDREGRYEFTGLGAGAVTVVVTFTGLDQKRVQVSLGAGERAVRDVELTAEVYRLDKFTVAGEREGTAKAETLQKLAPNVKQIVSSDTFGNVADGNIGDMLQHMVGITADYNGPDVRQVSIRGVGSSLNSVTMDGQQVASAQSAGSGRQFEFEQASLGNIETIEVTKAPTPDMDGASIGGSVNLVTKSAFDRAGGRLITFGLGFTAQPGYSGPTGERWKQPIKGIGPSANFNFQDVLGERRNVGLTLTGLIHSQPVGGAIINSAFERKDAPGPAFTTSTARVMVNGATRSRIALGAKLDYKFSDRTIATLNTSWNFFHENNDTRNQTLATTATTTVANVDANGNRVSGGLIKPGYTDTFTQIFADPNSSSAITMTSNDKSGRTYLFSPRVRHRFDTMLIDYSLSWSNSATYYDIAHNNEKYHSRPKGTITYRLPNIGWAVDRAQDNIWPTIRQTQGADMNNISNYGTLLLTQQDMRGYDTVINGKFDLRKNLALRFPTYVKTGFSYQYQHRHLWNDPHRYNYTGLDGIFGNADDNLSISQFADIPHTKTADEDKYFKNRGGIPPWLDPYRLAEHQKSNPGLWREDVAFTSGRLTSDLEIEERIAAVYLMGNMKFDRLTVLAGVRVEDTRDEGEGPFNRITPAEAALRANYQGVPTDAEIRRRNLAQFGNRFTNQGQYRFVLPGVHLKYEPFPNFVSRLSWSTGVGRPPFGSIIPNTMVTDPVGSGTGSVTLSNPNLKPQYSNNGDLSLEYYFKPQGMISFGAFRKKIRDYIATNNSQFVEAGPDNGFDGQYVGYRITTAINDGYATIDGLEFAYQQQLTFLPGWAKGFGVYTNFTKLRTEGRNSNFTTGPVASAGGTIANFIDRTGNIGLGYRGFGFDLRLQTVYRGKYLRANNAVFALIQYQEPKWTWNWKSRYTFKKGYGVFLDLENMFEVPLDRIYAAYPNRVISYRTFHTKIVGGITGRF